MEHETSRAYHWIQFFPHSAQSTSPHRISLTLIVVFSSHLRLIFTLSPSLSPSPTRDTCRSHVIFNYFIAVRVSGEQYKLRSCDGSVGNWLGNVLEERGSSPCNPGLFCSPRSPYYSCGDQHVSYSVDTRILYTGIKRPGREATYLRTNYKATHFASNVATAPF